MVERTPTTAGQELGAELRTVLQRSGLNSADVGRFTGWSHSKVSRLLSGKNLAGRDDVHIFLGVCRVEARDYQRLLELCDQANNPPGWWQRFGTRLPDNVRTMARLEDEARSLRHYESMVVPGLLQTARYAEALIGKHTGLPAELVQDRVRARLERQQLLDRRPRVQFTFVLDESALYRIVGDRELMFEQIHHLLRLSVREYVGIQVQLLSAGVHPGIAGPFTLIESDVNTPVVYLESESSCLFLEEPEEIAAYRRISDGLATTALGAEQSRTLLTRAAERYAT